MTQSSGFSPEWHRVIDELDSPEPRFHKHEFAFKSEHCYWFTSLMRWHHNVVKLLSQSPSIMIRPKVWLGLFHLFKLQRYFPKLNISRRLRERIWNLPKSPKQWHSLVLNNFCHSDFVFKRNSSRIFFVCAKSNKPLHLQGLRSHFWFFFLPPSVMWNSGITEQFTLLSTHMFHLHPFSHAQLWSQQALVHIMHTASFTGVPYVNARSGKRRHVSHPDGNSVSLTHPLDTLKLQLW